MAASKSKWAIPPIIMEVAIKVSQSMSSNPQIIQSMFYPALR